LGSSPLAWEMTMKAGDQIETSSHKGLILVDIVGTGGSVVGRKLRRDGQPSRRDVIVDAAAVRLVRHRLPGL